MTRFTLRDMLLAVTFFAIGLTCSAWYAQSIRAQGLKTEGYSRKLEAYADRMEADLKKSEEEHLQTKFQILHWIQSGSLKRQAAADYFGETKVICFPIEEKRTRPEREQ